jgi:K+-sensing histidine kinase KdpD
MERVRLVAMDAMRLHRNAISLVAGALLPLGVAALLIPFRPDFASPAAALVLVAVIAAVAIVGHRASGLVASISATLWFDVFLTRPYERLAITHRPDIETTVSLFVVGVVVTELAARSRHHRQAATEEADYVGVLYEFAELVATGAPADDVIERGRVELIRLLDLRACRYETAPAARPLQRLHHDGQVLLGNSVWEVEDIGLPGPELELLVYNKGQLRGRFVLTPTPGSPVSLRRRVVAVSICDQIGAALAPRLRSVS